MSALAFGAAPIGNLYSEMRESEAEAAIEAAYDAGIRYFDTAPHYGLGLSERRLGAALEGYVRSSVTISTKVGRVLVENASPSGSDIADGFAVRDDFRRVLDFSRDGIRRSISDSLRRLGTDYIDIALVHDPEDLIDQAIAEALPALAELRDEGVVRAIGAGIYRWQPLKRAVEETDVDVVMTGGRWTLIDRSALPLLETCQIRSVAVLAAAPFNSGILAQPDVPEIATFNYFNADAETLSTARRLASICRSHGVELPAAALQFPLRHPSVASVVCGMRRAQEVRTDASLFATPIPERAWEELMAEPVVLGASDLDWGAGT